MSRCSLPETQVFSQRNPSLLCILCRPEVDLTHYPDYISLCPRPMSLEKVEQLLGGPEDKNREYLNHGEFVRDMRLIFSNAMAYNNPDRIINELDRVRAGPEARGAYGRWLAWACMSAIVLSVAEGPVRHACCDGMLSIPRNRRFYMFGGRKEPSEVAWSTCTHRLVACLDLASA